MEGAVGRGDGSAPQQQFGWPHTWVRWSKVPGRGNAASATRWAITGWPVCLLLRLGRHCSPARLVHFGIV